jgi:hypothetical protein
MLPGLSEEQERDLVLSVGTGLRQRRLKPVVVADYIRKTVEAGASLEDVAKRVGLKSTTMLGRFLRLGNLNGTVRAMVDWGSSGTTIAFTTASELARLNESDQEFVAVQTLERALSNDEVEQIVQYAKRSDKTIEECVDAIVKIRPTHSHRYVFVGTLQAAQLGTLLGKMDDRERSKVLREILEAVFPDLRGTAHYRLTPDRFIINSTVNVASIVGSTDVDTLVEKSLLRTAGI